MPLLLRHRQPSLREYMDDPACDPEKLTATYRQFRHVNRLFSGWHSLYRHYLKPRLLQANRPLRLLDIGCGGADIPRNLIAWAEEDGQALQVTAIDPDARAIQYLRQQQLPANLEFRQTTSADLVKDGERFDIVTSNHLLHHLSPEQLSDLLRDAGHLSDGLVLFNDLRRSDLAYAFFPLFAGLVFRGSFIAADGAISLRRSYTAPELRQVVPPDWQVIRRANFHLLLKREI